MRGYDRGYDAARHGRGAFGARQNTGREYDTGFRPARHRRGVYGEDYPAFGGRPGDWREGMYYGRRQERGLQAGYDRASQPRRSEGYDRGFAREPFVPEQAYRQHPELARPPEHEADGWPAHAELPARNSLGDEEIRQSVRQNLSQDSWVDADRIDVSVSGGVVTLAGEVDEYLQARYAWDDAWEANGTRGVMNQLTVRLAARPGDDHGDVVLQTE